MPKEIVPILSGGGTRLSCYIGILKALQHQGLTFHHIVGVSGGSIVAALLAAGWNLQQMHELALQTDFRQFRGLSITKLVRLGGLSDGNAFESWLDKILEGKRFIDLQLDLHVLATDIQGGGPVIFNRQLTPELKVSQAIRFSMSIPLFFSFKRFKHHVMTDGVILSEDALHRDWSGQGLPLVCFRLKSEASTKPIVASRYFPVLSYIYMLIQRDITGVCSCRILAQHHCRQYRCYFICKF